MKPKLTPWFPAAAKPARPGVYMRQWPSGTQYARFDGEVWRTSWGSPHLAQEHCVLISGEQFLPWRGLASKP